MQPPLPEPKLPEPLSAHLDRLATWATKWHPYKVPQPFLYEMLACRDKAIELEGLAHERQLRLHRRIRRQVSRITAAINNSVWQQKVAVLSLFSVLRIHR